MSIISSLYAEYAEDVRIGWAKALRNILESNKKSDKEKLEEVSIIMKKIEDFYFSE